MNTVQDGIQSWSEALAGAWFAILAGIPKFLGFLVILLVGWLVASLLSGLVGTLLRTVKFNDLAQRAGLSTFVQNMGLRTDASGFMAMVVKWFVWLITFVVAFDALGLPAVSNVLQQLLLWLPNLVVALLIIVIGGLAANALANLVRGATATARLGDPNLMATITRVAVWAFAIVAAITQLGIAPTLVNTLVVATVGAVALAMGLAFGLGGRDTAGEVVRNWYQKGKEMAPQVREAAQQARTQGQNPQNPNQGQRPQ